ncbi:MAG: large conductance mechanosensitive channel protein MscL [Eubacterium sp.]|nr:large conductance mechanosensitive channel protein MscL [Eubacterium sp.]
MKGFIKEFKEFISRGNVMDMAVGIIIGSAFTAIVTALVDNVIMPLISVITGGISFDQWNITLGSGKNAPVLGLGTFIAAVINFLLIALVLFCVIKAMNKMHEGADRLTGKTKEEEEPTTKICPYCKSEIPIGATRCPHCTSILENEKKEA